MSITNSDLVLIRWQRFIVLQTGSYPPTVLATQTSPTSPSARSFARRSVLGSPRMFPSARLIEKATAHSGLCAQTAIQPPPESLRLLRPRLLHRLHTAALYASIT
ncbi:mRNA 3'-end-processing protein yth1 [Coccidioides immitis RMSCC 3703]|uniref:mRNA 3'-end-processing protein yth1 n=1 Tax=Coccidioides immitis RMSCC 3703 TaxID=454286 RepID=A0A0J8R1D3_COCIT|nr:mRNA 3'-end-processing protein yth1 [Coccidioides immitis RMSCC 3703]